MSTRALAERVGVVGHFKNGGDISCSSIERRRTKRIPRDARLGGSGTIETNSQGDIVARPG